MPDPATTIGADPSNRVSHARSGIRLGRRNGYMGVRKRRSRLLRAAAAIYAQLTMDPTTVDGEVWFEFAAVQLLAGNRQGYRDTCKRMLEGSPKKPKIRDYLLARTCTLAPDSVDDWALPMQVSELELQQNRAAFWSLTEKAA